MYLNYFKTAKIDLLLFYILLLQILFLNLVSSSTKIDHLSNFIFKLSIIISALCFTQTILLTKPNLFKYILFSDIIFKYILL